MRTYRRSVSAKGQITIPADIRRRLHIEPKDQVIIEVAGGTVTIKRAPDRSILASYRTIPALSRQMSVEEMTEIAAEEHAHKAAKDGLQIDWTR